MLLPWIAFGVLCFAGFAGGQKRETSACFVTPGSNMLLSCPNDRRIFILKMLYGSKPSNMTCPQNLERDICCQPGPSDCLSNYSDMQFGVAYRYHGCWNSTMCSGQAQQAPTTCLGYPALSTFVVADYSCLGSEDITAFHDNTTITAPAVAVHYDSADNTNYPVVKGDNQTWHCQVDTTDCVQRQADVILVKESHTTSTFGCSSVGWSGGTFLPCGPHFRYTSFTTSTPLYVSVRVEADHRLPSGWAVVRAQDNSSLTVTCGFKSKPSSTVSPCPVTSSSEPPSTSLSTSNQRISSSSITAGLTTLTPSTGLTSATSSVTPSLFTLGGHSQPDSTSPEVTKENNTGAVVGGVVAAVLVLVAAVVAVFCFLRRRRHSYDDDIKPPGTRKTFMQVSLTPVTTGHRDSDAGLQGFDGDHPGAVSNLDSDYAILGGVPGLQNSDAAASSIRDNARSPSQDPDYVILGEKKTQSSKLGRLGEVGGGGKDTQYTYDHLPRGRKAAPDIINSDYDTAGLHMTSEGDYNVVDFHKGKQRVITGSAYDVAEIVTSDDTEYYNVASEPSVHVRVEAKSDIA